MVQPEIQRACKEDCPLLHKLQIKIFTPLLKKYEDYDISPAAETLERFSAKFDMPVTDYWNILLEGERIGGIRIYNYGESCKLSNFFILQELQNRGIGQQVIRLVEARYPKAKHWRLETILQEAKLCHLYEKMGYRKIGDPIPVKPGMDLIAYEKEV